MIAPLYRSSQKSAVYKNFFLDQESEYCPKKESMIMFYSMFKTEKPHVKYYYNAPLFSELSLGLANIRRTTIVRINPIDYI